MSMGVYCAHLFIQLINGLLINSIALAYNAFVFLWFIFIIYQVKAISATLKALNKTPMDPYMTRTILIECHEIHLECIL